MVNISIVFDNRKQLLKEKKLYKHTAKVSVRVYVNKVVHLSLSELCEVGLKFIRWQETTC